MVEVGIGTPAGLEDLDAGRRLPAGPGEVYRVDPVTGEVSFGNFDPQHRDRPRLGPAPAARRIRAARYRYVDVRAPRATWPPARSSSLGTTLAGALPSGISPGSAISAPASDGADEEPIDDTLRRAPEQLKIRDRAVTADDYEFLAREASNDVVISRCLAAARCLAESATPWSVLGRGSSAPPARSTSSSCRTRARRCLGPSRPRTRSGSCATTSSSAAT